MEFSKGKIAEKFIEFPLLCWIIKLSLCTHSSFNTRNTIFNYISLNWSNLFLCTSWYHIKSTWSNCYQEILNESRMWGSYNEFSWLKLSITLLLLPCYFYRLHLYTLLINFQFTILWRQSASLFWMCAQVEMSTA